MEASALQAPCRNLRAAPDPTSLCCVLSALVPQWDAYVAFFTAAGNNEADAIRSKFDEAKAHADFALPGGLMESMADLLNRSHPAEEYDGFTPMLAAAKAGAYESVCGLHENGAEIDRSCLLPPPPRGASCSSPFDRGQFVLAAHGLTLSR